MITIKVFLGYDHQGVKCKDDIINYLNEYGYEVEVPNIENNDTDDYPDFAKWVCHKVLEEHSLGILVCGSGIGMSIAANKVRGIRCARVIDSNDIKKIIEENTEFKVIKDMSKGSKREDIVAFNLSLSIDVLNEEIKDDMDISEADEDTLFEEYMAFTEELGFELEEYLPEDSIVDFKAYKWEPSDNDIKAVIVIANEELGLGKLKDVMRRLLTQVE